MPRISFVNRVGIVKDVAHRNFITNAIEDSVLALNKAIKALAKIRTSLFPLTRVCHSYELRVPSVLGTNLLRCTPHGAAKDNFGAADVLPLTELVYSF